MIIRGRADKDPRRESFNNTGRDRDRSPKIDDIPAIVTAELSPKDKTPLGIKDQSIFS